MALPQFGSPMDFVVALIEAACPTALVTSDPKLWNRWSEVREGRQFVFVQDLGGSTPSFLLQTDVRFEVQSYVHQTDTVAPVVFAQAIQRAIYLAAYEQTSFAGGHARRPTTEVRPYHQALAGIPATVVRHSATYTIGYRSR